MIESKGIYHHWGGSPFSRYQSSHSYTDTETYSKLFLHRNHILQRFDELCKSFGNTLLEVGISICREETGLKENDLVNAMRIFRNQMPAMKARGCMSFRIGREETPEFVTSVGRSLHVFEQTDVYWTKVRLDD